MSHYIADFHKLKLYNHTTIDYIISTYITDIHKLYNHTARTQRKKCGNNARMNEGGHVSTQIFIYR